MNESSIKYWNSPEAGKRHLVHVIFWAISYNAIICIIYLTNPDNLFLILAMLVIQIWIAKKDIGEVRRKTSHPLCRLTDEFIISDLDRKVTPWNDVTHIDVDSGKKDVKIWHVSVKDSPKKSPKSVKIYGKWMKEWDTFLEDLKAECEKRSIEFKMS